MGGAVNSAFNDANRLVENIPVIGKASSNILNYANPLGIAINAGKAIDRGSQGVESSRRAPGEAAAAADKARKTAQNQADDLAHNLLIQPKQITPDNFLANKASQLANLRLGMASTVVGSGKASGAAAATPSLTGDYPGKKTLGS